MMTLMTHISSCWQLRVDDAGCKIYLSTVCRHLCIMRQRFTQIVKDGRGSHAAVAGDLATSLVNAILLSLVSPHGCCNENG